VVAAIAIVTSILSWRKNRQIENELLLLKEENKKLKKVQNKSNNFKTEKKTGKREKVPNGKVPYETNGDLAVMRIGVVRSIYRLCVGTPRQGLLAPDARGRIELDKIGDSSTGATVDGLEEFSYIWVLFHFHLNTQSAKKERRFKSKIAPPALGGKKIGIYATRSPHRHNPIGITLCKLDRIQVHGPHEVTLHVSGLDLVDGTPVLDIKPYVPVYDSVNILSQIENPLISSDESKETSEISSSATQLPPPRVPEWVAGGLATKRNFSITEKAQNELEEILQNNSKALEFYGSHCFADLGENTHETMETMLRVIEQVLSIDVRSSHQTRKARKGRSQAERAQRIQKGFNVESAMNSSNDGGKATADTATPVVEAVLPEKRMCTQQLDNLLISFSVQEAKAKRESSEGSGAEDGISVESIQLLPSSGKKQRGHR